MSGDVTARNSKQLFLSGNSNTLPKLFLNEEENEPLCFLLPVLKLQLFTFYRRKALLLPTGARSQVHKTGFCTVSELCKDTPGIQCTIP